MENTNSRWSARKTVTTVAIGLGVLAGSAGLASALGDGSNPAPPANAESEQENEPAVNGSIQVADSEGISEADEAAKLAELAKISADEAAAAAVQANPGSTVSDVQLGNEDGSVVYEVRLMDSAGAAIEVVVDAGNGSILAQEADDGAGEENEADEANESEENEANESEENEADEANESEENEAEEANEANEGNEANEAHEGANAG